MLNNMKAALFDLDGVIVDTAKYHFLAWKRLAQSLNITFTEEDNEKLKGVSRRESLEIILSQGNKILTEENKEKLMELKNQWYVDYINEIKSSEILPGALQYLERLKSKKIKIALGSASKNAGIILTNLGMMDLFDAVIDGNKVQRSKPDPQVFTLGAESVGVAYKDCVVFEDSQSGLQAAKKAGMYAIGIGLKENLPQADMVVPDLNALI